MNKNHGGKRKGAGRPKLPKKKRKIAVQFYEPVEIIEAVGGLNMAKLIGSNAINFDAKAILKNKFGNQK